MDAGRLRSGKMVNRPNDVLKVLWEYDVEGQPLEITWVFSIHGKALAMSAVSHDRPVVTRFSLGGLGGVPLRKPIDLPYLVGSGRLSPHARRVRLPVSRLDLVPCLTMPAGRGRLRSEDRRHAEPVGGGRLHGSLARSGRGAAEPSASAVALSRAARPADHARYLGTPQRHLPGRRREPAGLEGQRRRPRGDHRRTTGSATATTSSCPIIFRPIRSTAARKE